MRHTFKNAPPLEKYGTLGKMRHIRKNAAHSEKYGTPGKMRHTRKNRKLGHTWKNASQLAKCATL